LSLLSVVNEGLFAIGTKSQPRQEAHNREMRLALAASWVLLLMATGWRTGPVSLTPRQCSAADTKQQKTLVLPSTGNPVYFRYCGPARALVRVNGRAYRIRGGRCIGDALGVPKRTSNRIAAIAIGLLAPPPARPRLGIVFWWDPPSTRQRRVTIHESEIEVPGRRIAASGAVIVGRNVGDVGTFRLYGRAGAGPTGDRVTGSWTCG
jgi:hypothetical protein